MTPIEIEVLLQCYYLREPLRNSRTPAVQEALSKFLRLKQIKYRDGIIQKNDNLYDVTEAGRETVNRLCAVQMTGWKETKSYYFCKARMQR